ncbi:membrane lipoprotein lipid attachment site-containing protein [Aerococcus viridans]
MKKIIIGLLAVVILGGCVGFSEGFEDGQDAATEQSDKE